MLFTITHYVGEDLKCDFALIDTFCVLICKKIFIHRRQNETFRNETIHNYLSQEYFVLIL